VTTQRIHCIERSRETNRHEIITNMWDRGKRY